MSNAKNKPRPDAIPTLWGWADPETGELLVSYKGLANPVLSYIPNVPAKHPLIQKMKEAEKIEKKKKPAPVVVEEVAVVEEVVPQPKKKNYTPRKKKVVVEVPIETPAPKTFVPKTVVE